MTDVIEVLVGTKLIQFSREVAESLIRDSNAIKRVRNIRFGLGIDLVTAKALYDRMVAENVFHQIKVQLDEPVFTAALTTKGMELLDPSLPSVFCVLDKDGKLCSVHATKEHAEDFKKPGQFVEDWIVRGYEPPAKKKPDIHT